MGVLAEIGALMTNRAAPPARTEERSTYSLGQLGLHMLNQFPGSLGVNSIDEALRDAATWQCVKVKAQGLASLPVDVVRYQGKTRVEAPAPKIITDPSGIVKRRPWTFQAAASMFTDGNVFGKVTAVDPMGRPASIELIDPAQVHTRKFEDGIVQVTVQGEVMRRFPHGDLWHVPGEMMQPGSPFGLSPIWYGSKHVATALAAEAFGGQFFTQGGHPTGLLQPDTDPGQQGAQDLKDAFLNATRGKREPVVVPKSVSYQQLQIDPKDSQFIELMNFEVLQACRRHGVPPSMLFASVQGGSTIMYANVTQADLHFLKHSLSYPIDLFEDALSELLPAPRVVKYRRDAILRADAKGRWEVHDLRLKNRTTSVDEVRALEDEEPYGGAFSEPGIPDPTMGGPE